MSQEMPEDAVASKKLDRLSVLAAVEALIGRGAGVDKHSVANELSITPEEVEASSMMMELIAESQTYAQLMEDQPQQNPEDSHVEQPAHEQSNPEHEHEEGGAQQAPEREQIDLAEQEAGGQQEPAQQEPDAGPEESAAQQETEGHEEQAARQEPEGHEQQAAQQEPEGNEEQAAQQEPEGHEEQAGHEQAAQKEPAEEPTAQLQPDLWHEEPTAQLQPDLWHEEPTAQLQPDLWHEEPTAQLQSDLRHEEPTAQLQPDLWHEEPIAQPQPEVGHQEPEAQQEPVMSEEPAPQPESQPESDLRHAQQPEQTAQTPTAHQGPVIRPPAPEILQAIRAAESQKATDLEHSYRAATDRLTQEMAHWQKRAEDSEAALSRLRESQLSEAELQVLKLHMEKLQQENRALAEQVKVLENANQVIAMSIQDAWNQGYQAAVAALTTAADTAEIEAPTSEYVEYSDYAPAGYVLSDPISEEGGLSEGQLIFADDQAIYNQLDFGTESLMSEPLMQQAESEQDSVYAANVEPTAGFGDADATLADSNAPFPDPEAVFGDPGAPSGEQDTQSFETPYDYHQGSDQEFTEPELSEPQQPEVGVVFDQPGPEVVSAFEQQLNAASFGDPDCQESAQTAAQDTDPYGYHQNAPTPQLDVDAYDPYQFNTSAKNQPAPQPAVSDAAAAHAEAKDAAHGFSVDELRGLVNNHLHKKEEEAPPESKDEGLKTRFVGAGRAQETQPSGSTTSTHRVVPTNIRKSCQLLGVNPEDMTKKEVLDAWKRQMTKVHPDTGGDTEMATMLNRAKDTLIKYLEDQEPKLGKTLFRKDGSTKEQPKKK